MPAWLTKRVAAPVSYPATMHAALQEALQDIGKWKVITVWPDGEGLLAKRNAKMIWTFNRTWREYPNWDPRTTDALAGRRIDGRCVQLFSGDYSVELRVRELSKDLILSVLSSQQND